MLTTRTVKLSEPTKRRIPVCAGFLLSFILAVGSFGSESFAASPAWQWKQQIGRENSSLNDVVAMDDGVRVAVGEDATILRSAGSNASWSIVAAPGRGNLNAAATSGKSVVAVGDHGLALYSGDGRVWKKARVKNTIKLSQISEYYRNRAEGKLELQPDNILWMDAIWDGKQYVAAAEGRWKGKDTEFSSPLAAVSANGTEWKVTPLPSTARISLFTQKLQVVRFKSNWLIVASEGTFYSRDLNTWSFRKTDVGAAIHGIAHNGKVLVAVGWDGRAGTGRSIGGAAFTSEDGLSYTRLSNSFSQSLNAVIWEDGKFVMAGDYGSLYESRDGKAWQSRTQEQVGGISPFFPIQYSGLKGDIHSIMRESNGYVAVGAGGAIRSAIGLEESWTLEASGESGDWYGIAYSGGRYALAGTGSFKVSEDGKNWAAIDRERIGEAVSLYDLNANQGFFAANGFQMIEGVLNRANFLYAGGELLEFDSALPEGIQTVSAAGGQFRVFGKTKASISKDGRTWTPLQGVQAIPVATSGKLWLGYRDRDVYTSKNGRTWSKAKATVDGNPLYNPLEKAVWTGTKFVAINGDDLIESSNGTTWKTTLDLRYEYLRGLAVNGEGTVVAVGDKGMIYMSEKGKGWTKIASPTVKMLRSVVWDGQRFLAVGDSGVLIVGEKSVRS
ncbi:sialidase family protein [Cohnella boryungensis]|uniref:Photosynthesis system II assembly factor Ycf48/Hcf136-like domain-containing protein n=1 Tax=Cohnella boryungensis TaxID=768479 RepID=A0ABV8S9Y7_9BACL